MQSHSVIGVHAFKSRVEIMLQFILLVLFCTSALAEVKVANKEFEFSQSSLVSAFKNITLRHKPDRNFVATAAKPSSSDFEVRVAEELSKLQKDADSSTSTLKLTLPEGKTLDDYVAFVVNDTPSIVENWSFNANVAYKLSDNETKFAIKQLPNITEKSVCPNIVELEKMLKSNFAVSGGKVTEQQSPPKDISRLRDSIAYDVLSSLDSIDCHVYIPSHHNSVVSYINSALPSYNTPVSSNIHNKVWRYVMGSLKRKDDKNVQRISLKSLIEKTRSIYSQITTSSVYSPYSGYQKFPGSSYNIGPETYARIPSGLDNDVGMSYCDKIYVDFGTLPVRSDSSSESEMIKGVLSTILSDINSGGSISSFISLISKLQNSTTKSNYRTSLLAKCNCKDILFTFQELNEAVAKECNLVRISFTLKESDIVDPPADSQFKVEKGSWTTRYSCKQFPQDEGEKLSKEIILQQYLELAKNKVNMEQSKEEVRQEFFKYLWATESVTEFSQKFGEIFESKLLEIEKQAAEERRRKEEEERKEKEREERLEKERSERNKSVRSSKSPSNVNAVLIIVIFGGASCVLIIFYFRKRESNKGAFSHVTKF